MGAPEFVCPEKLSNYKYIIDNYTKRAKRVLILAESSSMPLNDEGVESVDGRHLPAEIVPAAFIIMGDKVREDAKSTLDFCATGGGVEGDLRDSRKPFPWLRPKRE